MTTTLQSTINKRSTSSAPFYDKTSLCSGFVWAIGSGLLKNLGAMDFAPLNKGGDDWGTIGIGGTKDPYQRADGDLVIVSLHFIDVTIVNLNKTACNGFYLYTNKTIDFIRFPRLLLSYFSLHFQFTKHLIYVTKM